MRVQLAWVGPVIVLSVILLLAGVAYAGTPRLGLLSAALVPVAAGLAIVHGQHLAAYTALSWLSRVEPGGEDRPTRLAEAVAQALSARRATLWIGVEEQVHAVGVWPESEDQVEHSSVCALLAASDLLSPREREVLELMARGLSNAAICKELHLSVKTVEPIVSAIFSKLGLSQDSASNRRVLAVLAYLRT